MNDTSLSGKGIHLQVVLLVTLPVFIIGLLLSVYLVQTRMEDTRLTLEQRGGALARHLAPITEFGIFAGDHQLLHRLIVRFLEEPGVSAITILDRDKRVLVRAVSDLSALDTDSSALLSFTEPVFSSSIAIEDYPETHGAGLPVEDRRVIGWVKVDMTSRIANARNATILRNSLLISLAGLLMSILMGLRLGRRITRPIIRLKEAFDELQNGQMDTRIPVESEGEIGALEEGFNTMAEAIAASHRELERHVNMATTRLRQNLLTLAEKNVELEEARLKALHSGKEKSAFLFNMSHEIRTPLNAIIGYTRLLEKTELDKQQREFTQIVQRSSRQLLSIIDDILNFSRLEAGKVALERIPFDLHACCEGIIAMLMPSALEKDVDLALLIHSDVPQWVVGDANRLGQILINLLNNAIKFTPPLGNVSLHLLMAKNGNGKVLVVRVIDTGIGMDRKAQAHVFEQFRQGDESITRRYGGTGLGLAIVARLVQLMHGEIAIDSRPGRGTTIDIRLSCDSCRDTDPPDEHRLIDLPCLIFDRNPVERRAIRNQLLNLGAEVFVAKRPEDIATMLEQANRRGRPIRLIVASLQSRHQDIEHLPQALETCRLIYDGKILLIVDDIAQRHSPLLAGRDWITCLTRPVGKAALLEYLLGLSGENGGQRDTQATDETRPPRHTGLRILFAEDNELNRRLVTTLLEERDCTVVTTINGHHALNTLCAEPFDLLLLDIHLPELDGIELARQIRAMEGPINRIPIVALTADIYRGRRSFLQANGIDGCVFKPVEEEALWRCIEAVLEDRQGPDCWPGQIPSDIPSTGSGQEEKRIDVERRRLRPRLAMELERHLDALRRLDPSRERQTIHEISHQINGLAGFFRLQRLLAAARETEASSREDSVPSEASLRSLIEAVEEAIETIAAEAGPADETTPGH